MTGPKLSKPLALDVIPASEVGALIEETDRVFVRLEHDLEVALAEADEVEALATAEGIDPAASTWTMVRLQRFLDDLREEARRDAAATIAVAEQRVRVERADARQVEARQAARLAPERNNVSSTPAPPISEVVPAADVPQSASDPGAADSAARGPAARATAAAVSATPMFAAGVASASVEPLTNGNGFAPSRQANPGSDGAPVVKMAPAPVAPDVTNRHVALSPTAVGPAAAPVFVPHSAPPEPASGGGEDFWRGPEGLAPVAFAAPAAPVIVPAPVPQAPPHEGGRAANVDAPAEKRGKQAKAAKEPKPPKERRGVGSVARRLPIAAILEVFAVLLILVFILLRLS